MEQMEERIRENVNRKLRNLIAVPSSASRETSPNIKMPTIVHQRTLSGTVLVKSHRRSNSDYQSIDPAPTIKVSQYPSGLPASSKVNGSKVADQSVQRPIRMSTSLSNLNSPNTDNYVIFRNPATTVGTTGFNGNSLGVQESYLKDTSTSSPSNSVLNFSRSVTLSRVDTKQAYSTAPSREFSYHHQVGIDPPSNTDRPFESKNVPTNKIRPPVAIKPSLLPVDVNRPYTSRASSYGYYSEVNTGDYSPRGAPTLAFPAKKTGVIMSAEDFPSSAHSPSSYSVVLDPSVCTTERVESVTHESRHRIQCPTVDCSSLAQHNWDSTNQESDNAFVGHKHQPNTLSRSEYFTGDFRTIVDDRSNSDSNYSVPTVKRIVSTNPLTNLRLYRREAEHFVNDQRFGGSTPCINEAVSHEVQPFGRGQGRPSQYVSKSYVNLSSHAPPPPSSSQTAVLHQTTNSSVSDCHTTDSGIERWHGSTNDLRNLDSPDDVDFEDHRDKRKEYSHPAMRARALQLISLTSSSLTTKDDSSQGIYSLLNSPDYYSVGGMDVVPTSVHSVSLPYHVQTGI